MDMPEIVIKFMHYCNVHQDLKPLYYSCGLISGQ